MRLQGAQKEKDEQQKALERLVHDSRLLGKSPEISAALLAAETRWDNANEALDARAAALKKAADAWTAYEHLAGQLDKTLDQQEKAVANLPATAFVETSQLEAQLRTTKVRCCFTNFILLYIQSTMGRAFVASILNLLTSFLMKNKDLFIYLFLYVLENNK